MIIPGAWFNSSQSYPLIFPFEEVDITGTGLDDTLQRAAHDTSNRSTLLIYKDQQNQNSFHYKRLDKNGSVTEQWPVNGATQVVPLGFAPMQSGNGVKLIWSLPIVTELCSSTSEDYSLWKVQTRIYRGIKAWSEDPNRVLIYDSGLQSNPAWAANGYNLTATDSVHELADFDVKIGQTYHYIYNWTLTNAQGYSASFGSDFTVTMRPLDILQDCISLRNAVTANSLKIKFNEKLGSIKYNYADTVTTTLGSEYPIVRRNGKQRYRTFTIEGLISQEANDNFVTLDDSIYAGLDTYDQWTIKELMYRNAVIDFLHDGAIKLYSSTQEGNMLVRLTNISLTPNDVLGRNIWTFSATATEIAAATPANLQRFGFQ